MSSKRNYTPSPELIDLVKQHLYNTPHSYSTVADISYNTKLSQATVRRSLKSLMSNNLVISASGKDVSRNGARLYRAVAPYGETFVCAVENISLRSPEVNMIELPWWKKILKFLKIN